VVCSTEIIQNFAQPIFYFFGNIISPTLSNYLSWTEIEWHMLYSFSNGKRLLPCREKNQREKAFEGFLWNREQWTLPLVWAVFRIRNTRFIEWKPFLCAKSQLLEVDKGEDTPHKTPILWRQNFRDFQTLKIILGQLRHRAEKRFSLPIITLFYAESDSVNNSYQWKSPFNTDEFYNFKTYWSRNWFIVCREFWNVYEKQVEQPLGG